MPKPEEQLQAIYMAGFELETFDRFPNCLGVSRNGCIALVQSTPAGLKLVGQPGWRMGELLGVLVTQQGRQVFQSKNEIVEATPEKLAALTTFDSDLKALLTPTA